MTLFRLCLYNGKKAERLTRLFAERTDMEMEEKQREPDQRHAPLIEALSAFAGGRPAYFRIPGHRFARGIPELLAGAELAELDLSEAEGLDDLHAPAGAIREAQELAARLWGADRTFFLVNGTTCGNEALVLSAAGEGEEILVPRNAHKSVLAGLILSGARPVYVMPEFCGAWGIPGGVSPAAVEAVFRRHPGCRALLVVSPTYYGLASDLAALAAVCHAHGAALLADEAHGAHLYFSERLPAGALIRGADACAMSVHKTAGSFTQSSLLHLKGGRLDPERMAANLQIVQSTSPSYLLMASLDGARRDLALYGRERMERAEKLSRQARTALAAIPYVDVLGTEAEGRDAVWRIDPTRLVFSAARAGITGYRLQEALYELGAVSTELADEWNVAAVITWANTAEDVERLADATERAVRRYGHAPAQGRAPADFPFLSAVPPQHMTPRAAYFAPKRSVPLSDAIGRTAGEMVVPYPPGIPVLCPGEEITREAAEVIRACADAAISFHGTRDPSCKTLQVVDTRRARGR